jgi:hypothetical protein
MLNLLFSELRDVKISSKVIEKLTSKNKVQTNWQYAEADRPETAR